MSIPALASSGQLGDVKATIPSEEYFIDRLPRRRELPKYRQTSLTTPSPAMISEVIRLSFPSLLSSHSGIWEPVKMTGFDSPSSMNDRADAL